MYTGMRIGEASAIRWKDYNVEEKTIHVKTNLVNHKDRSEGLERPIGQLSRVVAISTPKTDKSVRKIPLSNRAIEALNGIKKYNIDNIIPIDDNELIFQTQTRKPIKRSNVVRSFNYILENARTTIQKAGLHSLRHTFASYLLRNNVNIQIVSELLGHAKVSTTYNVYSHLVPQQKIDAISVFDDIENS